jgi:zinc protease
VEDVNAIDISDVLDIYRQRFSGASDFTFYISGSYVDQDSIQELIVKYIGSIPSGFIDRGCIHYSSFDSVGKLNQTIHYGDQNKAEVCLYFPGTRTIQNTSKNRIILDILKELYGKRIIDRLRGKEGAVYAPVTTLNTVKVSDGFISYRFALQFDCKIGQEDKLILCAQEEFRFLQEDSIRYTDFVAAVQKVKFILNSKLEFSISQAANRIYDATRDDSPEEDTVTLEIITIDDIQDAIANLLTEESFQRFVLVPDKS